MKTKIAVLLITAAMIFTTGCTTYSEKITTQGTVKNIVLTPSGSNNFCDVSLQDNSIYQIPFHEDCTKLLIGENVSLTYRTMESGMRRSANVAEYHGVEVLP
jgi:hypothetical protein